MKNSVLLFTVLITILSCTKEYTNPEKPEEPLPPPPVQKPYGDMAGFFSLHKTKPQVYTFDQSVGIDITAPMGSHIIIPPNAFVYFDGTPVTGDVEIEFKEIYNKSQMLLSNMPTVLDNGEVLISGGELFIKPTSGGVPVTMAPGYSITVEQPLQGYPFDNNMLAYEWDQTVSAWTNTTRAEIVYDSAVTAYYSMVIFSTIDSGIWVNCDDPFFSSQPQTPVTFNQQGANPALYGTAVFILFDDINAMFGFQYNGNYSFENSNVPVGVSCTMVAVGVKDSALYSAFIPFTVTTNLVQDFTLTPTTDAEFIDQLEALD